MQNDQKYLRNKQLNGALSMGAGVILFALSLLLKSSSIQGTYLKMLQGIGVFLLLWGLVMLIQVYLLRKQPASLKKEMAENLDERKTWIRYRSGNNAFLFGITSTYLALLVVGMTESAISPDLAWWILAGMVVMTFLVFIISLVVYENRY